MSLSSDVIGLGVKLCPNHNSELIEINLEVLGIECWGIFQIFGVWHGKMNYPHPIDVKFEVIFINCTMVY